MTELLERDLTASWREQALCLNEDPAIFWIDAESGDNALVREKKAAAAKQVCEACPVKTDCLLYGLLGAKDDHWSILGGTTHRERRAIRRQIGWT